MSTKHHLPDPNTSLIRFRPMNPHLRATLQALFVAFLWSSSWVFIKIGLQTLPPLTFAGLRYFLAFVCLLAVLAFSPAKAELRRLPKRTWARLGLLGLLFYAGTQGASFVALSYLPAVTVNLLWSFNTIVIALLGILFLAERPTLFQWGGAGLALIGAALYFYPVAIPKAQSIGVLIALAGILTHCISLILGREVNRSSTVSPLVVTVISMGVGGIVLLAAGLSLEGLPTLDLRTWAIIAWLAVVNTAFAFTLMNATLRTLTAMESSIISSTMLIWIPIFAVTFLGERITPKELLGLLLAGLGTVLVQLRRPPKIKPGAV